MICPTGKGFIFCTNTTVSTLSTHAKSFTWVIDMVRADAGFAGSMNLYGEAVIPVIVLGTPFSV